MGVTQWHEPDTKSILNERWRPVLSQRSGNDSLDSGPFHVSEGLGKVTGISRKRLPSSDQGVSQVGREAPPLAVISAPPSRCCRKSRFSPIGPAGGEETAHMLSPHPCVSRSTRLRTCARDVVSTVLAGVVRPLRVPFYGAVTAHEPESSVPIQEFSFIVVTSASQHLSDFGANRRRKLLRRAVYTN